MLSTRMREWIGGLLFVVGVCTTISAIGVATFYLAVAP